MSTSWDKLQTICIYVDCSIRVFCQILFKQTEIMFAVLDAEFG